MTSGWQGDKERSDQFIPTIKSILAGTFIKEATPEADQKQNTDYMLAFIVWPHRVMCRIRDMKYSRKYPFDITIRFSRPTGTKTEFDKLIDGWGDYFLYGFGNKATISIDRWVIIDLKQLRAEMIRRNDRTLGFPVLTNSDGTRFIAMDTRKLQFCVHDKSLDFFSPKVVFTLPLDITERGA